MAVRELLAPMAMVDTSQRGIRRRTRRWRFFQVWFFFLYLGIVLDEVTTALGFVKTGGAYEQNPLGSVLIGNLGWIGLLTGMTAICILCYLSFRVVYARMSPGWSLLLNTVVVIVTLIRWLAVVTAVVFLAQ